MSCCFHFFHPSFISPTSAIFPLCIHFEHVAIGHKSSGHVSAWTLFIYLWDMISDTLWSDTFIRTHSTTVSGSRRTWTHRSTVRCSTSSRSVQGRFKAVCPLRVSHGTACSSTLYFTKRKPILSVLFIFDLFTLPHTDSDSDPMTTLYCTETVPLAPSQTQILIHIQIPSNYGTICRRISVPGSGTESVSGNVNKPIDCWQKS